MLPELEVFRLGIILPGDSDSSHHCLQPSEPCVPIEIVLPDPHHVVPTRPKLATDASIPLTVPFNLRLPEFSPRLRHSTLAFWAPVPEATIDEQRQAIAVKKEVRFPRNISWVLLPSTNTRRNKRRFNPALSRTVPSRTYAGHTLGSLVRAQRIHHNFSSVSASYGIMLTDYADAMRYKDIEDAR